MWVCGGGGARSRPLKTSRPARRENSTAGSVRGMSTTHGHFTHHTRHNKPSFRPGVFRLTVVCFELREGWLPLQKKMLKGGGR